MLWPSRMAWMAAASITAGTGVSQTPWARLMPPMRSHSAVMARISDWKVSGASWLRARREAAAISGTGKFLRIHLTVFRLLAALDVEAQEVVPIQAGARSGCIEFKA